MSLSSTVSFLKETTKRVHLMEKPDLDLEGLRLDPSLVGEVKPRKEEAEVSEDVSSKAQFQSLGLHGHLALGATLLLELDLPFGT